MKSTSLQNKFLLPIGLLVLVALSVLILYFSVNLRSIVTESSYEKNEQAAANLANQVDAEVEIALDAARTVAQIFDNYVHIKKEDRRNLYNSILQNLLNDNSGFLCVWSVWEPNALDSMDDEFVNTTGHDNTGRFVPAWYRNGNQINVQPNYDYMVEGTGDYYQIPKKTLKETVIGPYYYAYTGKKEDEILILSLVVPIINNGIFVGVAGIDIPAKSIQEIIDNSKITAAAFSNNGMIAAHFDKSRIGKQISETEIDMAGDKLSELINNIKNGTQQSFYAYSDALKSDIIITCSPIYFGKSKNPWALTTGIPVNELFAKNNKLMYVSIIIGIVVLVVTIFVLVLLIRSFVKPILQGIDFATKIANGDLNSTIQVTEQNEIGKLLQSLKDMSLKIKDIVSTVISNADNITNAANQISSTSQSLSQGANQQASAIEKVSASVEEMSSNIKLNTNNALQTDKIAAAAAEKLKNGSESVIKTVDSLKIIADKVSIINEIAFQTNILALNAAVEAARAGNYGKGFAVVAAEVRKLAERSQKAAKEIDELTKSSVDIGLHTVRLFEEIVPSIENTAGLVQEISASGIEQNRGVEQISHVILKLNEVSQQNAAASEELATSAEEMAGQALQLQEVVSFFKINR